MPMFISNALFTKKPVAKNWLHTVDETIAIDVIGKDDAVRVQRNWLRGDVKGEWRLVLSAAIEPDPDTALRRVSDGLAIDRHSRGRFPPQAGKEREPVVLGWCE